MNHYTAVIMGWWWSASSPPPNSPSSLSTSSTSATSTNSSTSANTAGRQEPSSSFPIVESSREPARREEEPEKDLETWLRELEAEEREHQHASKPLSSKLQSNFLSVLPPVSSSSSPAFSKPDAQPRSAASRPAPKDISPDSLSTYPSELSCRSAFDYAFFCQSFGGQFVNVYRYGTFRSCTNHWDDFWLCMRTRNWAADERKRAIQDHYRKKSVKYKTGPSSEDVWEVRTEPIKSAFQGDLEELEGQIEDWRKANPDKEENWKTT